MRKACLDCTFKHLASAEVAEQEFLMGYPSAKRLVVGQLDHAATECYAVNRELAMVIREHRINWFERGPEYHIPYEELCGYVELCSLVDEGDAQHAIPESCTLGLNKDADGVKFTEDTRSP